MISVTPIYDRPYKRTTFTSYDKCSEFERAKLNLGYKRIKGYKDFILYGKYDYDGNLLYKECFSRFDVEGVKAVNLRGCHGPIFKY